MWEVPHVFGPAQNCWNPTIVGALIALAGALIGALIGSATNYFIAWKKQKADAEVERQRNLVEVKRAARLIETDFLSARAVVALTISKRLWNQIPLYTESWQKYKGVLAAPLSYDEWLQIDSAWIAIDYFIDTRKRSLKDASSPTICDTPDELKSILEDVAVGLKALRKWSADQVVEHP